MNTPDFPQDPELMNYLTLDDRPGPSARISKDRALAMVSSALAALPAAPLQAPKHAGGTSRTLLVAGAMLLGVASFAAAARWYFSAQPPTAAAPAAQGAASPAVAPATTDPRAAAEPSQPAGPAASPLEPSVASDRARSVERAAPEDLLQKANRLRTVGKFRESAQTYAAVSDRYPKTLSAYVAQVATASIELEHLGRPARARRLFERALREHPEGALDLEARQGLATALRDLAEPQGETTALQALIEHHAESPAARRAQIRLQELEAAAKQ